MRLAGRHRSLQQLWDIQISTASDLQAPCSVSPSLLSVSIAWQCAFKQACGVSGFSGRLPARVSGHPLSRYACIWVTSCLWKLQSALLAA